MGFSEEEENSIKIGLLISCSISICCSSTMLLLYTFVKELRTFFMKFVLFLVLSDLIYSGGLILPGQYSVACIIQSLCVQIGAGTTVWMSAVIAYALFRAVILQDQEIQKKSKYLLGVGIGVPFLFMLIPFTTNSYGPAQGWCWINAQGDQYIIGTIYRLVLFYIPLFIILVFNTYIYIRVILKINKEFSGLTGEQANQKAVMRRMILYPMVLVVCFAPVTIKRVYDIINPDKPVFILAFLAAIFLGCIGTLNALIYGFTDSVRQTITQKCCRGSQQVQTDDTITLVRRLSHVKQQDPLLRNTAY